MPGDNAGCGGDAGRVDLLHFGRVGEHVAELAGEEVELGWIELEVRQCGDGGDIFTRESGRHRRW